MIKVETKLLQLWFRIYKMGKEKDDSKDIKFKWKRLTRRRKSIHLALEVKTFIDNSTPTMGPSTESSPQKPELPLIAVIGITRRERKKHAHEKL
jgi:hypothetical protein